MESLQPSELQALLGIFADKKWDSDSEAILRSALRQRMVPEALQSKLDWPKPVRIIHNITLPEQRGSDSSVQKIPLHKCDLELHVTSKHKEGMAKLMFCHLHMLSQSTQSSACVLLLTPPSVVVLSLCSGFAGQEVVGLYLHTSFDTGRIH